ncbi:DUF1064 domain-containing protein [Vibrio sp. S11_S32]|uniref:DUF1064 domain-containing protein n=1 Tax=Vibrio sp. S11_S32 TaxID=2720225 RepID=UPI0016815D56|nr:DUF1064 domain-containing protein [Vibrio sp. S11_S32]MBD1577051.1 DUF1064 domain-containing protein [Vibrio sp. S11_S32]
MAHLASLGTGQRISAADFRNAKDIGIARVKTSKKASLTTEKEPEKRHGKYNAKKTEVNGIMFDSKLESKRYVSLSLELRAGLIQDLQLQVPYPIEINNVLVCKYVADFVYKRDGVTVVEDSKGTLTPEYKL